MMPANKPDANHENGSSSIFVINEAAKIQLDRLRELLPLLSFPKYMTKFPHRIVSFTLSPSPEGRRVGDEGRRLS